MSFKDITVLLKRNLWDNIKFIIRFKHLLLVVDFAKRFVSALSLN